jgi:AcrR family transcriptional regulator
MGRPRQDRTEPSNPTRRALLQAAIGHMRDVGEVPSFAEVAAAAGVPLRTAYRYYPTVDELAADATVEFFRPLMERLAARANRTADPVERAGSMARNVVQLSLENETVIRTMIRLTIKRSMKRGHLRLSWFRDGLAPLRPRLGEQRFERLVRVVAIAIGFEGLVAYKDMVGADPRETAELTAWIAEALVLRALSEAENRAPRAPLRSSPRARPA